MTGFDPLAPRRGDGAPEFDVFVSGTVFLDIVFAGLPKAPTAGTEVWAEGMASCPGGIANLAVAASRLGLRTSLAAAFSDDDYGDFCWRTLHEQEGIDLGRSRQFPDWHSPVTVSMSVDHDRSMVSHGHPSPVAANEMIGTPPTSGAVMVDLNELVERPSAGASWIDVARANGALVFADTGWDPTENWDPVVLDELSSCHAFLPNATEAMSYTRTSTPQAALHALADRVPLAVVTNGADGAMAIDATTGEEAHVAALEARAVDPTGAGDVFGAAMLMGTLARWPLADRLAMASLCSALAVGHYGGSLAAPGWGDVVDWWSALLADPRSSGELRSLRDRFGFLHDIASRVSPAATRRAAATIARRSDLDEIS